MRELRCRVRWFIQDVQPARHPNLEAALLGVLGLGFWTARCAIVILIGGGPM